ncbi:hypothetical protein GCM10010294_45100 [Streptomyces griseoloalbus]|nr:hypothetical protein GCM10010294_45100 [Streptomyces griseoloalbus]
MGEITGRRRRVSDVETDGSAEDRGHVRAQSGHKTPNNTAQQWQALSVVSARQPPFQGQHAGQTIRRAVRELPVGPIGPAGAPVPFTRRTA